MTDKQPFADDFANRRVLITGGAGGMGRAIGALFAARGASVWLSDLDLAATQAAAAQIGPTVRALQCDVTDEAQMVASIAQVVADGGGLDIMINNAGIEIAKSLFEQTVEEFDRLMAINVKGVFLGIKHAVPAIRASGGRGAIVNLASIAGMGGSTLLSSYCASKAAVIQLTRVAAAELRSTDIRVNAVCPGLIDTAMLDRLSTVIEARSGIPFETVVNRSQGRMGRPEEVAEVIAFLASDDADWARGAHFTIDGGRTGSLLG